MNDIAIEVGVRAVRRAASVLIDAARDLQRLPAHRRAHELVAEADGEAEDAIIATLRAAFPEHAILGEESAHIPGARDGAGYKWFVDAIDAPTNFAHGVPCYAVSVALARGSRVSHAIVLDPLREELFTAIAGQGARCNDAPLHISACPGLDHALVGSAVPPRTSPALPPYLRVLGALTPRLGSLRSTGAPVLDLAHVAMGRLDAFFATHVPGWDVAAGALLVAEAGGRVGDFSGNPEFVRGSETIAAAPVVFTELREALMAARRPAVAD